jgi:hypothetical protein
MRLRHDHEAAQRIFTLSGRAAKYKGGPKPAFVSILPAVPPPVATTAGVRFARFGFVHLNVPALKVRVVEALYSRSRVARTGHLDEAKAFGLAGKLVRNYGGALHFPRLRKEFFQVTT